MILTIWTIAKTNFKLENFSEGALSLYTINNEKYPPRLEGHDHWQPTVRHRDPTRPAKTRQRHKYRYIIGNTDW